MSHLSLAGVSEDGRRLLLVSDRGTEFTLDITPGLRAALRGQTTRLGQLEMQMSSTLRPRDIQHRIRGGESPEEVAEAAGSTVDAIMAYAAPVLAERQHIAERAQKSSLRRSGDSAGASHLRQLGEAVTAHLAANDARPDQVSWDSYRREDGRWVLTADFVLADNAGTAKFVFDAPGNYVTADNDDARLLIGDTPPPAPARVEGQRHLSAVADQLPLGDDALDMVRDGEDGAPVPDEPIADTTPPPEPAAEGEDEDKEPEPAPAPPQRRTPPKKRGRASVPSWDEIMFGGSSE
ncbi:DUF3071 domain-containing protein [Nocardioides panacisoli]|uniref:septation protein SepH n=1 Tax=Nocardioides panacisoli TaxID=627624 RepID=UPI001C62F28E|nr:septation protein SepH [Nocardioides panacisoli]QYJ04807.1 DUF3071 domain-containing protein [Nocardioides panacisoli]